MKKYFTTFLTLIILLTLIYGCTNKKNTSSMETNERNIFAMDTFMTLKAFGKNAEKALADAEKEIFRLESLFNINDENSDIYKINKNAGNKVKVCADTIGMINQVNEISNITNQAIDITVFPIVKEWGFTTNNYKIPDDEKLNELLKNVDYRKITIEKDYITIPENYSIDVGAVAKGYTSDKIIDIFKKNGIKSAIVNLGGNVHTVGLKENGDKWKVAIKNPIDTSNNICVVEIENKCVITSGNYERYFVGKDGKKYWHIIDTKTGKPANNGIISSTVIGDNGTICDSLSTATFVMGTEKALEFAKENADLDFIFVTEDMQIYCSKNIVSAIKKNNNYKIVIIN